MPFVSVEPLLGPVDLSYSAFNGEDSFKSIEGIHWVICGGESGPGARPFDILWARSLRHQCKVASVPFFMKQLGANPVQPDGKIFGMREPVKLKDRKGGDWSEWPGDLRVREFPK